MSKVEELHNNRRVEDAETNYNSKRKKRKQIKDHRLEIDIKQNRRTRVFRNAWDKINEPIRFETWL